MSWSGGGRIGGESWNWKYFSRIAIKRILCWRRIIVDASDTSSLYIANTHKRTKIKGYISKKRCYIPASMFECILGTHWANIKSTTDTYTYTRIYIQESTMKIIHGYCVQVACVLQMSWAKFILQTNDTTNVILKTIRGIAANKPTLAGERATMARIQGPARTINNHNGVMKVVIWQWFRAHDQSSTTPHPNPTITLFLIHSDGLLLPFVVAVLLLLFCCCYFFKDPLPSVEVI